MNSASLDALFQGGKGWTRQAAYRASAGEENMDIEKPFQSWANRVLFFHLVVVVLLCTVCVCVERSRPSLSLPECHPNLFPGSWGHRSKGSDTQTRKVEGRGWGWRSGRCRCLWGTTLQSGRCKSSRSK